MTVLHIAAQRGHAEVVRVLLRAGANASQENDAGSQALHYAAQDGHPRVVEVLLDEAGVDIKSRDANGRTPIFLANHEGHVETLRLLVRATVKKLLSQGTDASIGAEPGRARAVADLEGRGF